MNVEGFARIDWISDYERDHYMSECMYGGPVLIMLLLQLAM